MITMKEKTGKKIDLFRIVNYIVLAVAIVTALYIMANGLGLIDSLGFGAEPITMRTSRNLQNTQTEPGIHPPFPCGRSLYCFWPGAQ